MDALRMEFEAKKEKKTILEILSILAVFMLILFVSWLILKIVTTNMGTANSHFDTVTKTSSSQLVQQDGKYFQVTITKIALGNFAEQQISEITEIPCNQFPQHPH